MDTEDSRTLLTEPVETIKDFTTGTIRSEPATGFYAAIKSQVKSHKEGLFGLVMGLIALGLEFLLDDKAFSCPRANYQLYSISFIVVPGVLLWMLNILTFPASGNISVWTLCESCWVRAYWRRGDVYIGFMSAFFVGLVAPTVWLVVAFFNGRYLCCWELGYQFGANVTNDYLEFRGFDYLNVSDYMAKVDHAKSKSHAIAAILLGTSVLLLSGFIIMRRSCQKPYEEEDKLPALWKLEKAEALAAAEELEKLLNYGSNLREMPYALKWLVVYEQIKALEDEKAALEEEIKKKKSSSEGEGSNDAGKSEKQLEEIEQEIKELDDLLNIWDELCKLHRGTSVHPDEKAEYDKKKKTLDEKRDELIATRSSRIEEGETWLLAKMCSEQAVKEDDIDDMKYWHWLINRLRHQERHLEFDKFCLDEKELGDERLSVLRTQLAPFTKEDYMDSPESRGRFVAQQIFKMAREDPHGSHVDENVLFQFASFYPRAATCSPRDRYVNVKDYTYRSIVEQSGKVQK